MPPPPGPRRRGNEFATGGLIVGVIAFVVSLASAAGMIPAVLGLLLSAIGLGVGVRRDVGLAPALSGLLVSFLALAIAVFSAGISGT